MKRKITIFLIALTVSLIPKKGNAQFVVTDPLSYLHYAEQFFKLRDQVDKLVSLKNLGKDALGIAQSNRNDRNIINTLFSSYSVIDRILKQVKGMTSPSAINADFSPLLSAKGLSSETKEKLNEFLQNFGSKSKEIVDEMQLATNSSSSGKLKISDYERKKLIDKADEDLNELNDKKAIILRQAELEKRLNENIDATIENYLKFTDKKTIKNFFSGQNKIMYKAAKTMVDYLKYIVAIGLLCSIVTYAYKNLKLTGEPIVIDSFAWPLFISIFLFAYEPFMAIIDSALLNPINEATSNLPGGQKDILTTVGAYTKAAYNAEKSEIQTDVGIFSLGISGILDFARSYIAAWVASILVSIVSLITLVITLICDVLITVYIFFGPLAIALSAIPGFKSSFMEWLSGFIKISLCLPVANIIMAIFGSYVKTTLALHDPSEIGAYGYTASFIYMIVAIVALIVSPMLVKGIVARGSEGFSALSNSITGGKSAAALSKGLSSAGKRLKSDIANAAEGSAMSRARRMLKNK